MHHEFDDSFSAPTAGAASSPTISPTKTSARSPTPSRATSCAPNSPRNGVLVGYDNRFSSERFARAAAETIAMTGTPVWLAEAPCPSPAISLLVRQRHAAGGIMITASHNPAALEWNQVQGQLRQLGASLHRRADRSGATGNACQRRSSAAAAPRSASFDRHARALPPHARETRSTGKKCARPGLRFVADPMHGSARGLLAALMRQQRRRLRRNPRHARSAVRRRQSRAHRAARRGAARSAARRQLRRRICRRWRRRPHRRHGSRRHLHHAAPDLLHPALASRRHSQAARRRRQDLLHHEADRQDCRAIRPPRVTRCPSASSTSAS